MAQDLHLSSDGSDSENPEETIKNTPADEDSQLPADKTRTESGPNLPGTPVPINLTGPTLHPDEGLGDKENTVPNQ